MSSVCIITSCLNEAPDIFSHLEELKNISTNRDISYFVIDGGSTDGTISILEQHCPHANWHQYPQSSIYEAWNLALSTSNKYDYYCFLGTGDKLKEKGLKEALEAITSPKYDIVYGPVLVKNGKISNPVPSDTIMHWNWGGMPFCHTGALFSARLFDQYGLFDDSFRIVGDLEWLMRINMANKDQHNGISFHCTRNILAIMKHGGISSKASMAKTILKETRRANLPYGVSMSIRRRAYLELLHLKHIFSTYNLKYKGSSAHV